MTVPEAPNPKIAWQYVCYLEHFRSFVTIADLHAVFVAKLGISHTAYSALSAGTRQRPSISSLARYEGVGYA